MDSPYLAQALAQMKAQPDIQTPQAAPMINMQAMKQGMADKAAWEAANPGQSYMGHQVHQMGQNLAALPGRLAALPSQIMGQGQPPPMGQPQPGMAAPMPQQTPQMGQVMAPPPQIQGALMGGLSGLLSMGQSLRR